mmetsp:Transcript_887/g.2682  ORF Transcript_887/g.2682 Transcript_887/m.2682 type:complete len:252 (+) Transcript_887:3159-3914(+)
MVLQAAGRLPLRLLSSTYSALKFVKVLHSFGKVPVRPGPRPIEEIPWRVLHSAGSVPLIWPYKPRMLTPCMVLHSAGRRPSTRLRNVSMKFICTKVLHSLGRLPPTFDLDKLMYFRQSSSLHSAGRVPEMLVFPIPRAERAVSCRHSFLASPSRPRLLPSIISLSPVISSHSSGTVPDSRLPITSSFSIAWRALHSGSRVPESLFPRTLLWQAGRTRPAHSDPDPATEHGSHLPVTAALLPVEGDWSGRPP